MRDGAAAKDDPLAPSWANSASRRRVEGLRPPKVFSWRRYAIARVTNDRLISRDGAFPNMAFQRSRSSSISSFDRPAISTASASRPIAGARRFMIVSLDSSRPSARHPSSYVVLLEARDRPEGIEEFEVVEKGGLRLLLRVERRGLKRDRRRVYGDDVGRGRFRRGGDRRRGRR